MHRAHFLDELVKLVPDKVAHFGKRLEDIEDLGDHVVLKFHDGTAAKHSAVIGCDGVKSRTRQLVLGQHHPATAPTFSGKYAYRGLIPMDDASELLGDELARNAQMYLGHGGHILTFVSARCKPWTSASVIEANVLPAYRKRPHYERGGIQHQIRRPVGG